MTPEQWATIRHFKPHEFDSPDMPGSGAVMAYELVSLLDQLRDKVGAPLSISSGVRTPSHNATVGGVDSSAHEMDANGEAWAADISIVSDGLVKVPSFARAVIVGAAWELGFRRIGIGETFVHLDRDKTKPSPRIWTYPATRR